jgi:hypothetical protein
MWNDHPASYFYSSSAGTIEQQFKYASYKISYLFCLGGIHHKSSYKGPMLFPECLKRGF